MMSLADISKEIGRFNWVRLHRLALELEHAANEQPEGSERTEMFRLACALVTASDAIQEADLSVRDLLLNSARADVQVDA